MPLVPYAVAAGGCAQRRERFENRRPCRLLTGGAYRLHACTGIATLRDDIAELSVQLDAGEVSAETLPHRRKYLLLVIGFLLRLLELHLELVDEVERELAPTARRRERPVR